MHQQSRHPSRAFSPATSPQTNPTRSNNQRDALGSRPRAASESTSTPPGPSLEGPTESSAVAGPSRESVKKLDQIIQNCYLKAAVLIVQSRIPVTPSGGKKTNKWFQIETDDIDDFRDELKQWKHCGSLENRPTPMVIETYLDASRLSTGQALVVVDENGKRLDALEALNTSDLSVSGCGGSSGSGPSDGNKIRTRSTEIILERWKVELRCIPSLLKSASGTSGNCSSNDGTVVAGGRSGEPGDLEMDDFGPVLPTIYKRSIVFFRSLFVTTHVLPAYRFSRQAMTKGVHPALQVRCRVLTGTQAEARIGAKGFDTLRQPLFTDGGRDAVTDYMFGDLEVPIGRFSTSVTYRNDCSFRIDDSESLLSSRFMGIDENYFKPSLPPAQRGDNTYLAQQSHQRPMQQQPHHQQASRHRDSSVDAIGSLPHQNRHAHHHSEQQQRPPPQQTYGSLSTFHGAGAFGTSPISALKAVRPIGSETSSPTDSIRPSSLEQHRPQLDPPNSLPIATCRHMSPTSSISARPLVLRNMDGLGRRQSLSINPFKAGPLSGSPRTTQDEMPMPPSPLSGSRAASGASALAQARNRSSLTAGMAASLRGAPPISTSIGSPSTAAAMAAAATAASTAMMDPSQSSSPRPSGSRFSSSFTHRRGRSSFGGTSRGEDDQGSSGKQSLASSMAQPGSGLLAEAGGVASSGSFQMDDDNISDFLKALESKKTLQSFESSSRRNESARRTAAQLSRFQMMKESNVALTDSMSSSVQLPHRSLSSSLRQQGGVSGLSGSSGVSASSAIAGPSTSVSPSVSPKPLSPHTPHTPHTPAVPSRLSENLVINYQDPAQAHAGPSHRRHITSTTEEEEEEEEGERPTPTTRKEGGGGGGTATIAIDIPLSPRLLQEGRRPSSAVQKTRALGVVDDSAELAAFGGQRSLSAGADDRELPEPGAMFRLETDRDSHGASLMATGADSDNMAIHTGGLRATAAGILRPSSGGALPRSSGFRTDVGLQVAPSSMPHAPGSIGAALGSGTGVGTSQRRRYTSRYSQALQQEKQQQPNDVPSDGRPAAPHMSRGSMSGSSMGRYGTGRRSGSGSATSCGGGGGGGGLDGSGADGEADDDILVFDLSEFGS